MILSNARGARLNLEKTYFKTGGVKILNGLLVGGSKFSIDPDWGGQNIFTCFLKMYPAPAASDLFNL